MWYVIANMQVIYVQLQHLVFSLSSTAGRSCDATALKSGLIYWCNKTSQTLDQPWAV
jgi:hypothetical protein